MNGMETRKRSGAKAKAKEEWEEESKRYVSFCVLWVIYFYDIRWEWEKRRIENAGIFFRQNRI